MIENLFPPFTITTMPLSFANDPSTATSLAALLLHDCKQEITAESIEAVLSSSGVKVPATYPKLYATFLGKAGGCEKFLAGPGSGGGGGGGGGGAAPAAGGAAPEAKKEAEKPKEEEVDALDGGMDMFGGGGGGGGGGDY